MDEERRKEVQGVYDKLAHMHREPWTHRGTSTADPVPLSTWSHFRDIRYGFVKTVVVIGLEDLGTLPELVEYSRGELRGAALERRRVIIPQTVFIKQVVDALGEHSQRDGSTHKVVSYAHDSGFSEENIEGLRHFGINVVPDVSVFINDCSLVVDLRLEQGTSLDSRYPVSMVNFLRHQQPGAILKRSSTMEPEYGSLILTGVSYKLYEVVTHFELPSHAAPMQGAEKPWFRHFKGLRIRNIMYELRNCDANAKKNGAHWQAIKQFQLQDEDEQRLAQLARNMMTLALRKNF